MKKLLFKDRGSYYFTHNSENIKFSVYSDGVYLYFEVALCRQMEYYQNKYATFSFDIAYNGVTKTISASNEAFVSEQVNFDYDENCKTISLTSAADMNEKTDTGGVSVGKTKSITWCGSYDKAQTQGKIWIKKDGPVENSSKGKFGYSFGDEAGRRVAVIDAWSVSYNKEIPYYKAISLSGFTAEEPSVPAVVSNTEGRKYFLRFTVAAYESEDAGIDEYVSLTEFESPMYIVGEGNKPLVPYDFKYTKPCHGGRVNLSWKMVEDTTIYAAAAYVLKRSVDGGSFETIYEGGSMSFRDTVGENWSTVAYSVCSKKGSSVSLYNTGNTESVADSNIFAGYNGSVHAASALYIGVGGSVTGAPAFFTVGQNGAL